jgi:hypothetical protein
MRYKNKVKIQTKYKGKLYTIIKYFLKEDN